MNGTPTNARIAALWLHPIKSAAGIAVQELALDALGAVGDRRWMLTTPHGDMITARTNPALVRIQPSFLTDDRHGPLRLASPDHETLDVAVPANAAPHRATVWDDEVMVQDAGDAAAAWCTAIIGAPCRLARLHEPSLRPLQPKYTGPVSPVGRAVMLSDGAPLLVLSLASVDALNGRLAETGGAAADVRRFRANVLLEGCTPHEEDTWSSIHIGDVTLGLGTPCPRCVFTTVDPDTAATGHEPLRTLATYRKQAHGVAFGMNTTHAGPGTLRVGDVVDVISRR